ncbi:beta/gamma crystallin domain-containing protein 2 isoform X2 [Pelodiscus sinensis]|uniref:beta/gamma crystallin domain-containing protein 2 isoform X2 n=1 Tax=Pelodiscus sinensis TaxID=13735 RepID=UPI003F6BDA12
MPLRARGQAGSPRQDPAPARKGGLRGRLAQLFSRSESSLTELQAAGGRDGPSVPGVAARQDGQAQGRRKEKRSRAQGSWERMAEEDEAPAGGSRSVEPPRPSRPQKSWRKPHALSYSESDLRPFGALPWRRRLSSPLGGSGTGAGASLGQLGPCGRLQRPAVGSALDMAGQLDLSSAGNLAGEQETPEPSVRPLAMGSSRPAAPSQAEIASFGLRLDRDAGRSGGESVSISSPARPGEEGTFPAAPEDPGRAPEALAEWAESLFQEYFPAGPFRPKAAGQPGAGSHGESAADLVGSGSRGMEEPKPGRESPIPGQPLDTGRQVESAPARTPAKIRWEVVLTLRQEAGVASGPGPGSHGAAKPAREAGVSLGTADSQGRAEPCPGEPARPAPQLAAHQEFQPCTLQGGGSTGVSGQVRPVTGPQVTARHGPGQRRGWQEPRLPRSRELSAAEGRAGTPASSAAGPCPGAAGQEAGSERAREASTGPDPRRGEMKKAGDASHCSAPGEPGRRSWFSWKKAPAEPSPPQASLPSQRLDTDASLPGGTNNPSRVSALLEAWEKGTIGRDSADAPCPTAGSCSRSAGPRKGFSAHAPIFSQIYAPAPKETRPPGKGQHVADSSPVTEPPSEIQPPSTVSIVAPTGSPGDSHVPGPTGITAPTGSPGDSHVPGPTGVTAPTGSPGDSHVPGPTGVTAPTGSPGDSHVPGPTGVTAPTGSPGDSHVPGPTGVTAPTDSPGDSHVPGPTGITAPTGSPGDSHVPGPTSVTAPTDSPGDSHVPGPTGITAPTGSPGDSHVPGPTGITAPTGSPGDSHVPGPTGVTAPTGSPGDSHVPGPTGITAPTGSPGDSHVPGPTGITAPTDSPGDSHVPGPTGITAPTGSPGDSHVPGPTGVTAPTGSPGDSHVPGPTGVTAPTDSPGDSHVPGPTGVTAPTGSPGDSHVPGPTGVTAPTGSPGDSHVPGPTGITAPTGSPGDSHVPGPTGVTAPTGSPGDSHVPGPTGVTAPTSSPGDSHVPGPTGVTAPTDSPGDSHVPGPTGVTAPTGSPGDSHVPGPTGVTAPTGSPGDSHVPGPTGVTAPTDSPGDSHVPGPTGVTAPTDFPGDSHVPGPTGVTAPTDFPGDSHVPGAVGTTSVPSPPRLGPIPEAGTTVLCRSDGALLLPQAGNGALIGSAGEVLAPEAEGSRGSECARGQPCLPCPLSSTSAAGALSECCWPCAGGAQVAPGEPAGSSAAAWQEESCGAPGGGAAGSKSLGDRGTPGAWSSSFIACPWQTSPLAASSPETGGCLPGPGGVAPASPEVGSCLPSTASILGPAPRIRSTWTGSLSHSESSEAGPAAGAQAAPTGLDTAPPAELGQEPAQSSTGAVHEPAVSSEEPKAARAGSPQEMAEEDPELCVDMELLVDTLRSMDPSEIRNPLLPFRPSHASSRGKYAPLPPIDEHQVAPASQVALPESLAQLFGLAGWMCLEENGPKGQNVEPEEEEGEEEDEEEEGGEEEEEEIENPYLSKDEMPPAKEEPRKVYSWENRSAGLEEKTVSLLGILRQPPGDEKAEGFAARSPSGLFSANLLQGTALVTDFQEPKAGPTEDRPYSRLDSSILYGGFISSVLPPLKALEKDREGRGSPTPIDLALLNASGHWMPPLGPQSKPCAPLTSEPAPAGGPGMGGAISLEDGKAPGIDQSTGQRPLLLGEAEQKTPSLPASVQPAAGERKSGPHCRPDAQSPPAKLNMRPGKIVLFAEPGFAGQEREIWGDVANATAWELSHTISVRVVRGGWVMYEKPRYHGRKCVLAEGDVEISNPWAAYQKDGEAPENTPFRIGSLKRVVRDYRLPEISLFSAENGEGTKVRFTGSSEDTRLCAKPLTASSIIVHSGLWLIYSKPFFDDDPYVLEPGGYPSLKAWGAKDPAVCSLHPITLGCPVVEKPGEPKAVIYELAGFQGHSCEVNQDIYDLNSLGPGMPPVGSLRILGGCWVGYEKEGFRGHQYLLEEGEYPDWQQWGGCSAALGSLRLIRTDFSDPALVLFKALDFQDGPSMELSEALPDVELAGYGPTTQSIHVLRGVWVAYENTHFSGEQYVLEKGMYRTCEDWGASDSRIASVQPVLQVGGHSLHFVSRIQLFSAPGYLGDHVSFEEDQGSLPPAFVPQSCRVHGGSWILCEEQDFQGEQHVLLDGEYPTLGAMGCAPSAAVRSLRRVPIFFSEPSISLHGLECFEGKEVELSGAVRSLAAEGYNTHVLSVRVKGGIPLL